MKRKEKKKKRKPRIDAQKSSPRIDES